MAYMVSDVIFNPSKLINTLPNTKKGVFYIKMTESDVQNKIRLALSPYAISFRTNVGKVQTKDGRWFDTGLPPGFTDLAGFRKSDGKMFFLEVKTKKGRLRDSQKHFIETMEGHPVIVGVARSAEEAISIVVNG